MKQSRLIAALVGAALLASLAVGCGRQDADSLDSSLLGPAQPAAKLTVSDRAVAGTRERSPLRPVPGGGGDGVDGNVRFSYAVEECEPELLTRGVGEVPEGAVVAEGNAISLRHILDTFCTASEEGALELRPVVDGFRITVNEVFTGQAVRCTCPIPVSARFEGLEAGTYTVSVAYTVERDDGVVEEFEVLFETSVVVGDQERPLNPEGDGEQFPVLEADVNLTEADDGSAVELPGVGGQLVVALEGNPSTGYTWEVEEVDESVLRLVGDADFLADDPTLVGGGGLMALRFEGVSTGQTTLRLAYRRAWESDVAPLEIFEVYIEVR